MKPRMTHTDIQGMVAWQGKDDVMQERSGVLQHKAPPLADMDEAAAFLHSLFTLVGRAPGQDGQWETLDEETKSRYRVWAYTTARLATPPSTEQAPSPSSEP